MNAPSSIRPENGFEPGRLWSLWDMMQLHAGHAWRNPTMHIENKYTEEEAEIIFRWTRTGSLWLRLHNFHERFLKSFWAFISP